MRKTRINDGRVDVMARKARNLVGFFKWISNKSGDSTTALWQKAPYKAQIQKKKMKSLW